MDRRPCHSGAGIYEVSELLSEVPLSLATRAALPAALSDLPRSLDENKAIQS